MRFDRAGQWNLQAVQGLYRLLTHDDDDPRLDDVELVGHAADAVCVGLHPGTVDTGLSRPFQSRVPDAKLFTPDRAASQLLAVCAGLTPADSGQVFAWDGSPVPA